MAGFVVVVAVVLMNTAVTRRQLSVQDEAQGWVRHTQNVLLELTTVESLLKDAETGERGYLYTGDARYLAPYNDALSQLDTHLNRLAELTRDNPRQQPRIAALKPLVTEKRDELAQCIRVFGEGDKDQARALVLSGAGKSLMDQIRSLAEDVRGDENNLLDERLHAVKSSTARLVGTLYFSCALAIIALALLAWFVIRSIAERERYTAALQEREERFRVTLASIGDAVIATDDRGCVMFMNAIAEQLTGVPLARGRGLFIKTVFPIYNERTGAEAENPVMKVMEHGRITGLANHTILKRPDGKEIPIEDSAAPIYGDAKKLLGVVMVFRDATADRKAQAVLRKAEKLAAAGRLAATVAHEINNPLEAVNNLVFLTRSLPDLPESARQYLELMEQQLNRVAHTTRQTLGFYRESSDAAPVKLADVVQSVVKLYENKLKSKNITVEVDTGVVGPIRGLFGELQQVIANLVSNAADAVEPGGKINIAVRPAEVEHEQGVIVSVADDGRGVPPENRDEIFEPFFTTKKDVGTGLGLWVSREIAVRHGGTLTLASSGDGRSGAVFTLFLPYPTDVNFAETAGAGEN